MDLGFIYGGEGKEKLSSAGEFPELVLSLFLETLKSLSSLSMPLAILPVAMELC